MLSSSWNETNFNYEKSLIQIHQKLKRNFLFNIEIRFGPQGNKFAQVNTLIYKLRMIIKTKTLLK